MFLRVLRIRTFWRAQGPVFLQQLQSTPPCISEMSSAFLKNTADQNQRK